MISSHDQEDKKEQNIISLQAMIRRYNVKSKFVIEPLNKLEMTFDKTFAIGNDPLIANDLAGYLFDEPIALVATSGVRAIKLAAALSNQNNTPKIFLVDNSFNVHQFWKKLKSIFEKCNNDEEFLDILEGSGNLNKYCRNISYDSLMEKRCGNEQYPQQELDMFFVWMFSQYGFNNIKKMVSNTVLIKQSWAEKKTFSKLKNIITHLGINKTVAYPSNILATLLPQNAEKVRLNIDILNPELVIVTNLCKKHHIPHKVGFFVKPGLGENADTVQPMKMIIKR